MEELTLRTYQQECLDKLNKVESGSHMVALATGLGKCLAPGTEVIMYDGTVKKVEEIKEGDLLMGPDSKPRKVTSLAHGTEMMYKILQSNSKPYIVNESHILSLMYMGEKPWRFHDHTYQNGDVVDIPLKEFLDFPRKTRKLLKGYRVGVDFVMEPNRDVSEDEKMAYKAGHFFARGIVSVSALMQSREIRDIILEGMVDAAGYRDKELSYYYYLEFERERKDVEFFVQSLGYYIRKQYLKRKDSYCYTIVKTKDHMLLSDIKAIRRQEGEYYGFTLEGDDRRFLLGDFTVTHNTVIFSHLERQGRTLILSHRDELVHQPEKYYDCSFGVEQASEHSNGEEVVSASVQSLIHRLDRFDPKDFDTIIVDEAHHAAAPSYKKILNYFKPRRTFGFTATPNRGDGQRLDDVFDDIIYQKDILYGIQNDYLCDITCYQADIKADLRKVKKQMGDFSLKELGEALDHKQQYQAIAEVYRKYANGPTMIFAATVKQAYKIADRIPGSVVVEANTKDRSDIIKDFESGKIPCIINCMVFTEGTDIPCISTVIMARPTANSLLYQQAVGRGLRLYPGKRSLTLIDCVGITDKCDLVTAPSLLGLDDSVIPQKDRKKLNGVKLSDMEEEIEAIADTPEAWIINSKKVDLFAETNELNMFDMAWVMHPDKNLTCNVGEGCKLMITCPDNLGLCNVFKIKGSHARLLYTKETQQNAISKAAAYTRQFHFKDKSIWSNTMKQSWANRPATWKQIRYVEGLQKRSKNKYVRQYVIPKNLTKGQATIMIERMVYEKNQN